MLSFYLLRQKYITFDGRPGAVKLAIFYFYFQLFDKDVSGIRSKGEIRSKHLIIAAVVVVVVVAGWYDH